MEELTIDREFDELCPPLSADEERLLEESILADGCLHPIVTWANHDDTILDGHNRYRICRKHDRPYKTKALRFETREEAIAWILRTQMGRRNLSESQRAMLAAKMATLCKGEHKSNAQICASQAESAENFAVSRRTVQSAAKVLEHGAKPLQKAVESGDVPVSVAAVVAELPKAEQAKVVKQGPDAVKAKAKEVKQENAAVRKYKDTFDPKEIEKHKVKNGSEKGTQFKDGLIDELLGKLIRAVDDRWNKVGGHGNLHRMCVNKLREFGDAWSQWRKAK